MQSDEQQIRQLVSTWMSASKAGDSATVLGLMADDVQFLVAGHAPFGKEAFAAATSKADAANIQFDGKNEILEINVIGDWAFMVAKMTVTAKMPDAKNMIRAGHTMSVLTKKSGKWQLYRDANLLVPVDESARKS
jgi:uncharacterized protein (TIGR02246 family)